MTVSQMIQWSMSHPMEALGYAAAASLAFASAWAAVKAAYQRVTGKAMPRNAVTTTLDVLAELALNIPGAINRVVRSRGGESIFAPPPSPPVAPSKVPPAIARDGERGAVRVSVMLSLSGAILVASLAGAVLAGCPAVREGVMRVTPGVPDPSGCAEGAQRCSGSVPEVCSASHRWWPALPRRTDGTQRVCAAGCEVTDAGVAVCAALDGGAR